MTAVGADVFEPFSPAPVSAAHNRPPTAQFALRPNAA